MRATQSSSRPAALVEGQRAQVLGAVEQQVVQPHADRDSPAASSRSTALRFSRCCRSAKGATAPSRITSNSPSSTAWKSIAARISGKRAGDVLAAARLRAAGRPARRRAARGCRPISTRRARRAGSSAAMSAVLQRMRQHQRAEHRRIARVGPLGAAFQPGEQRQIGRRERRARLPRSSPTGWPDHSASAILASRPETPTRSPPVISLMSASRPVASERVQPAADQRRQLGLRRQLQRLDHLGQASAAGRSRLARRPDQRHRLGQVADIVVATSRAAPGRSARPPGRGSAPAWRRRRPARRSARPGRAAIRVGLRGEPVAQQGELGVAATGVKTRRSSSVGEGGHAHAAGARPGVSSSSSPRPTRCSARPRMPRSAERMHQRLVAAMRHPDLGRAHLVDGAVQLVPIGMVGDHQRQFDATRLRPLPHPHPAAGHRRPPARPAAAPSGPRWRRAAPARSRPSAPPCWRPSPARSAPSGTPSASYSPHSAVSAPCRWIGRPSRPARSRADQPLAFAQRVAADDMRALGEQRQALQQLGDLLPPAADGGRPAGRRSPR